MGLPKPAAIATLIGLERGTPPDGDEVARLYATFERLMIEHYRVGATVREADGATVVMRRLHESGVKVALDTGFARAITDVVVPRRGGGAVLLPRTVWWEGGVRARPSPEVGRGAMKLSGVSAASRGARVGDPPADLLEGTAAGCGFVIGVTSGSHAPDELR